MPYSKNLKKIPFVKHCFFTKKDGTSKGIYKSLNCGIGSNDKKNLVRKNLKIVTKNIGCDFKNLIINKQIHSNKIVYIKNSKILKRKSADALITKKTHLGLGILTADCAPILLCDPKKKIIGAIHAGWRGAIKNIIYKTIKKFTFLGSIKKDIIVSIGPCLSKKNYEVGEDFFRLFAKKKKSSKFFKKIKNKRKYLFDLRSFINFEFKKLHIKKIDHIKKDTFADKNNFFSYRRSKKNNEKDYGRCISVIMMT